MMGRFSRGKENGNSFPPGWYPDPHPGNVDGTRERFWDGTQWTDTVSIKYEVPLSGPPVADDLGTDPGPGEGTGDAARKWVQPPPLSELRIRRIQDGPQAGEITLGEAGVILNTVRRAAQDSKVYVPAAITDVAQHRALSIGAVSVRGLGHQDFGTARQDAVAFAVTGDSRFIVGAIADGVGGAPNSHAGADAASRAALTSVRGFLEAGTPMHAIPWPEVTDTIRSNLRKRAQLAFGSKLGGETADDGTYSRQVGTTAEVLVVDSEPAKDGTFQYVRAVLAGDGYGYIISPEGVLPLGSGKARDGEYKSNKVLPLPADPGPGYPHVQPGFIRSGEAVMITTDGVGDDMGDGTTEVAGYLYAELLHARAPHLLLAALSYVAYQSDDDRTVLVVWA
jgi:hypothetical protein